MVKGNTTETLGQKVGREREKKRAMIRLDCPHMMPVSDAPVGGPKPLNFSRVELLTWDSLVLLIILLSQSFYQIVRTRSAPPNSGLTWLAINFE